MPDEVRIDVDFTDVQTALTRLAKKSPDVASAMVEQTAMMIEDRAIKNINNGSRSGKVYKRRGVTHQASAPSEFPKTDTGKLVKNIKTKMENPLEATVGSRAAAPHGYWLEFGTVKMTPRPWLAPSAEQEKQAISKFIDKKANELLNGL